MVENSISTIGSFVSGKLMSWVTNSGRRGLYPEMSSERGNGWGRKLGEEMRSGELGIRLQGQDGEKNIPCS